MKSVKEFLTEQLLSYDAKLVPGTPDFEVGLVLLLMLLAESVDPAPISATLELPFEKVERIVAAGVAGGAIKEGRLLDAGLLLSDKDESGYAFGLTLSVLRGLATRSERNGEPAFGMTAAGRADVEKMLRSSGVIP